jgi:hypothetical protein
LVEIAKTGSHACGFTLLHWNSEIIWISSCSTLRKIVMRPLGFYKTMNFFSASSTERYQHDSDIYREQNNDERYAIYYHCVACWILFAEVQVINDSLKHERAQRHWQLHLHALVAGLGPGAQQGPHRLAAAARPGPGPAVLIVHCTVGPSSHYMTIVCQILSGFTTSFQDLFKQWMAFAV